MEPLLYNQSILLIVAILIGLMGLGVEAGFRFGRRWQLDATEAFKAHVGVILASTIGLLSLLLSFTFSWTLQRYEDRSEALVTEANAIGTTYLRTQLLPEAMRAKVQSLLSQYVNVRLQEVSLPLANQQELQRRIEQANQLAAQLWGEAMLAVQKDARPVTSGLFVQSLNQLIDSASSTQAAFQRRVPEIVFFTIFALSILIAILFGYISGLSGHRVRSSTFLLLGSVALTIFLIVDLDRPRSGVIQVNRETLQSLQKGDRPNKIALIKG